MSSLLCTLKQQIFTIVFTGFDLVKDRFLILLKVILTGPHVH